MMNDRLMASARYDDRRPHQDATFRSRACAGLAARRLSPGLSLILALTLSIGLWGVIWVAVTSLTSAVLR
jgi:hypothetical protein